MDIAAIKRERAEIISRFGVWTAHNIQLGDGISTIDGAGPSDKLRRIVQIVTDLARQPLSELRIVDLACGEGQYAIEFARHGAHVVAIEGREANLEKARFAKRVLGLESLELVLGDIRDLSREKYGAFDVVLCLGILYHLDAPDVFNLVENIGLACSGFAVFDTYISLVPKRRYLFQDKEYWGRDIAEHRADQSIAERLDKLWSSLDNAKSVWLTNRTLLNLLTRYGFTSIYSCETPVELEKPLDRVTVVAIKGHNAPILTQPNANEKLPVEIPEDLVRLPSHYQTRFAGLSRLISHSFPRSWRRKVKAMLRAVRVIRSPKESWERDDRFKW